MWFFNKKIKPYKIPYNSDLERLLYQDWRVCKIFIWNGVLCKGDKKDDVTVYFNLLINKENQRKCCIRISLFEYDRDNDYRKILSSEKYYMTKIIPWLSGNDLEGVISNYSDLNDKESDFFKKLQGTNSKLIEEITLT